MASSRGSGRADQGATLNARPPHPVRRQQAGRRRHRPSTGSCATNMFRTSSTGADPTVRRTSGARRPRHAVGRGHCLEGSPGLGRGPWLFRSGWGKGAPPNARGNAQRGTSNGRVLNSPLSHSLRLASLCALAPQARPPTEACSCSGTSPARTWRHLSRCKGGSTATTHQAGCSACAVVNPNQFRDMQRWHANPPHVRLWRRATPPPAAHLALHRRTPTSRTA